MFGENENTSVPSSMQPSIPPTPQATALTRLAEFKVNNWTGTPDIGVSLFDFDCDGYTIPFHLSYEAQPMRPGHVFDIYGRGWTLSGGSCVSRTIRGLADEKSDFNVDEEYLQKSFDVLGRDYQTHMNDQRIRNFQSDIFNVVLPSGRSVDFVMHKKDGALVYELSEMDKLLKIKCCYDASAIKSFVVTDEDGVRYDFTIADKASNGYQNERIFYNVTWLLTKVTLTNGRNIFYSYNDEKEIVRDNYGDLPITIYNEPTVTFGAVSPCHHNLGDTPFWVKVNMNKNCPIYFTHTLRSVACGHSTIEFNYSNKANDMISNIVFRTSVDTIKQYLFDIYQPLRELRKLSVIGGKDSLNYSFTYSSCSPGTTTDHWGNYGSYGSVSDVGNFNFFVQQVGDIFNDELLLNPIGHSIIRMEKSAEDDNDYTYKFKLQHSATGESRTASEPKWHGVLTSITYPNGGHTSFEFENHKFLTASMENGSIQLERRKQRVIEGGGFRIKTIKNYDVKGQLVDQYYYCYGPTYKYIRETNFPFPNDASKSSYSHTGCGEAVVDPNLLTYLNYDLTCNTPGYFKEMLLGLRVDENLNSFTTYDPQFTNITMVGGWWWEARFSAHNFRNLLGGRPAVVYPEITVYHGDVRNSADPNFDNVIGKTVYKFNVYSLTSPQTYQRQLLNHNWSPDTTYLEPLYYLENVLHYDEHKAKRNQLMSAEEYGRCSYNSPDPFRIVSEEKYQYSHNENAFTSGYIYNNRYNLEHNRPATEENFNGFQQNDFPHNPSVAIGSRNMTLGLLYSRVSDYLGSSKMIMKTSNQYVGDGSIKPLFTTHEKYDYLFGNSLKSREYNDKGVYRYEDMTYVQNTSDSSSINSKMKSKNMLTSLCQDTKSINATFGKVLTDGYKLQYSEFNTQSGSLILPSLYSMLYSNNYEDEIKVLSYTKYGKPQEVINMKTGVRTVYMWGYDYRYLIAEIQNPVSDSYDAEEVQMLLEDVVTISEINDTVGNAFEGALIKTWSYKPFVGPTATTDETGMTIYYSYDGLGRLQKVYRQNEEKDKELLNEYTYDYPHK